MTRRSLLEAVRGVASADVATPGPVRPSDRAVPTRFREELRRLTHNHLFWVGLAVKLVCATLLGSELATQQFAPFLYEFAHDPFSDVYRTFVERGIPEAFPYGPGMLLFLAPVWVLTALFEFDPTGHLGLLLLRLPLLVADLAICMLLMRWLRIRTEVVVKVWWISPILIYATYVHGQLDLVPTAMLCASLYCLFARRITLAALIFGLGLATKTHLLIALPFLFVYLFRIRRPRRAWLRFVGVSGLTAAALYALPLTSPSFQTMVFQAPQHDTVWAVGVPFGRGGPTMYVAPAMLLIGFITYAGYRRVNREMTLMFLGAIYVGLVALVPPQPGWFLWSLPFVAYMGAHFNRTRRIQVMAFYCAYLLYFFVGSPEEFLGAFAPLFGAGFAPATLDLVAESLPALLSEQSRNVTWTILFATTMVAAIEMFRRGVVANSIYGYRDQCFMIGIGGDSSTGKHTLGRDLDDLLGTDHSIVHGDDDHKWERADKRWEEYTHLDPRANLLAIQYRSLAALRRGGGLRRPRYEHSRGRFSLPRVVEDNSFISVIGLHPFYLSSQRRLFDLKVFLDPDESVRREWKVERDMAERGYTRERIVEQIEQRVPDAERYIRPQMAHADLVIRYRSPDDRGTPNVDMGLELSGDLEAATLLDALERAPTLTAEWEPDLALSRDRLDIRGTLTVEQLRALAHELVPELDQLVQHERWQPGGCGLAQTLILYSIGSRLRSSRRSDV